MKPPPFNSTLLNRKNCKVYGHPYSLSIRLNYCNHNWASTTEQRQRWGSFMSDFLFWAVRAAVSLRPGQEDSFRAHCRETFRQGKAAESSTFPAALSVSRRGILVKAYLLELKRETQRRGQEMLNKSQPLYRHILQYERI